MQKFGLDTQRTQKLSVLEVEILREQATALGRAGKRLRVSIERFSVTQSTTATDERKLIDEVAANVWELSLQREFVGMVQGNLEWIAEHYAIPREVLKKLGLTKMVRPSI
jgi:hypothetical protein